MPIKIDNIGTDGVAIGAGVSGGTANCVLFIDSSGNLAQESTFTYTATTNTLSIQSDGTNNIQTWKNSSGNTRARIEFRGMFTNDMGIGSNEVFGDGALGSASLSGDFNSVFGNAAGAANTSGNSLALFGVNAGAANTEGIQNSDFGANAGQFRTTGSFGANFGYAAGNSDIDGIGNMNFGPYSGFSNQHGDYNAPIGYQALYNNTGNGCIGIGLQAGYGATAVDYGIYIGYLAGLSKPTTGAYPILIGFGTNTVANDTIFGIGIGYGATPGSHQFVSGSDVGYIEDVWFGSGITDATPTAYTINGTGGLGSNIVGGAINIAGGKGTGTGVGGSIFFKTAPAGSTGSSLNALVEYVSIDADGRIIFNETGASLADFRVEGDTDANLLFTDASADTVQIGATTASDSAKFYVSGKISTSGEMEINGDLNHDGTNVGFYGVAPVARSSAYSITNVTTDRAYDANSTTLDEIADTLGTLIADLQLTGIIG